MINLKRKRLNFMLIQKGIKKCVRFYKFVLGQSKQRRKGENSMELKKVWMSSETRKKSRYGYRTVGKILGIVFLMTALLLIGTFLSLSLGLPQ